MGRDHRHLGKVYSSPTETFVSLRQESVAMSSQACQTESSTTSRGGLSLLFLSLKPFNRRLHHRYSKGINNSRCHVLFGWLSVALALLRLFPDKATYRHHSFPELTLLWLSVSNKCYLTFISAAAVQNKAFSRRVIMVIWGAAYALSLVAAANIPALF